MANICSINMAKIHFVSLSLCLCLFCLSSIWSVTALYEDQVGQNDWSKSFIGPIDLAITSANSIKLSRKSIDEPPKPIVFAFSSLGASLAAINGESGDIIWRRTFLEDSVIRDPLNPMVFTRNPNNFIQAKSILEIPHNWKIVVGRFEINLISLHVLNNEKIVLMAWDSLDGTIMWENVYDIEHENIEFVNIKIGKREGATNEFVTLNVGDKVYIVSMRSGKLIHIFTSFEMCNDGCIISDIDISIDSKELYVLSSSEKEVTLCSVVISSNEASLQSCNVVGPLKASKSQPCFLTEQETLYVVSRKTDNSIIAYNVDTKQTVYSVVSSADNFSLRVQKNIIQTAKNEFYWLRKTGFEKIQFDKPSMNAFSADNLGNLYTISDDQSNICVFSKDNSGCAAFPTPQGLDKLPKLTFLDVNVIKSSQAHEIASSYLNVLVALVDGTFAHISAIVNEPTVLKNAKFTITFVREESLSFIISQPVVVELSRNVVSSINSSESLNVVDSLLVKELAEEHDKLTIEDNFHSGSSLLSLRLSSQYQEIKETIFALINKALSVFMDIGSSQGGFLIDIYMGEVQPKLYTVAEKHNFGFLNVIIVVTAHGKVFGLQTDNGDTVFSFYRDDWNQVIFSVPKVISVETIRKRRSGQRNPSFMITTNTEVTIYDGITGLVVQHVKTKKNSNILDVVSYIPDKGIYIIIYDDLFSVETIWERGIYSGNQKTDHLVVEDFRYVHVPPDGHFVSIFGVSSETKSDLELFELSKITFPRYESIISIAVHEKDPHDTYGRNIGGGSVMIKYVNSNMFAVFSKNSYSDEMNIVVIDSLSGLVATTYTEQSCLASSVHHILYENNLVYTCQSYENGIYRTNINSLSFYFDTVLSSFDLNPFRSSDKFKLLLSSNVKKNLIVEQNNFFIEKGINSIALTITLHGVTEKSLVFSLPNGQIIVFPSIFFDPRRPIGSKLTKEEKEEGLPPYSPKIPLASETIISYYNRFEKVTSISVFPTTLESTCLLFACGMDIFFSRLQPSSGFDLLPEEFNYPLLICMVIGLFSLVIFLSVSLREKKLREKWK